ncbi:chondroitin AC/alginate lyase [Panus rudis PR-1116 ss-1]|nr:chondroitin AC/alginate lyase [Panus rudis PR-1116 ss-1]
MISSVVAGCLILAPPVLSFTSYANDFADPKYILSKNFPPTTVEAQRTILQWADEFKSLGPWTVVNKTITPPTGDKHDYMSLAPYWWPDCSKVGNTTELTPEQIWTTCPYVPRDGEFNPDVRVVVNDIGNFGEMSDGILYAALAWALNGSSDYASIAANYIKVWFIDPETKMNPNLNYAQVQRGPGSPNGTHTGILDLKSMVKILNGVLILRGGKAPEWTSEVDNGLVEWTKEYIPWLQTAKIAIEEKDSLNNHGSFYFNQLASLQILIGDTDGAKKTLEDFFTGIYLGQIAKDGNQPFESERTRPYHYRAYNLAAMITNARLAEYVGYNAWNVTSKEGATIQSACDYAMAHFGTDAASELYPVVGAVAAVYGDPDGKYAKFLLQNNGKDYPADASFLWNQPLSDSGLVDTSISVTGNQTTGGGSTSTQTKSDTNAAIGLPVGRWSALYVSCFAALLFSL